jgi:hypothetical protein
VVHPSISLRSSALEQLVHLECFHDRVSIEQLLFDGVARPRDGALFPDLERPGIGLFYEIDRSRGFARGFSIKTVGPLPIGRAEHVLADGHWGQVLRGYMRDYNHWYTAMMVGSPAAVIPGGPRQTSWSVQQW